MCVCVCVHKDWKIRTRRRRRNLCKCDVIKFFSLMLVLLLLLFLWIGHLICIKWLFPSPLLSCRSLTDVKRVHVCVCECVCGIYQPVSQIASQARAQHTWAAEAFKRLFISHSISLDGTLKIYLSFYIMSNSINFPSSPFLVFSSPRLAHSLACFLPRL